MKILITGISGFIGSNLCTRFYRAGHVVEGTARIPARAKCLGRGIAQDVFAYTLGDEIDNTMFNGVDCIIHAAYDLQKGARRKNVDSTVELALAAAKQGVTTQIFLSSFSARADAESEYGQSKYELERFFRTLEGGVIVRPGLVIGPGGIFARMVRIIKRYPVVPMLDHGKGNVPVVFIDSLCDAVLRISQSVRVCEYNLFQQELVSLRELLDAIRSQLRRRIIFISVPSAWMMIALSVLDRIRLPLAINIDNLKGFIKNQNVVHESNMATLGITEVSLREMVSKSASELQ